MCFFSKISADAQKLENRFNARFEEGSEFLPSYYNGFTHPETPLVTNLEPDTIKMYSWGLIPFWAKDTIIQKVTLNARFETIHEKPSFRSSVKKTCLVIADGFYEWQWLDPKGKSKQKYNITLPNNEIYAYAGLWSEWTDKKTGEIRNTYTILTTEANELMSEIHNTKKRMPIILRKEDELNWLKDFKFDLEASREIELIATKID